MASLAVFDFDRTIVDDDSDATIIKKLTERKPPPEWEQSNHDWTPYMSNVFEHAFSAGLGQADILACIASMRPVAGLPELLSALAAAGWDVLLVTDANSVFVQHWLKTHDLEDKVTDVLTNRAFFEAGRLFIEPLMNQSGCPRCPTNLCKWHALSQWCGRREYRRLVYVGDGTNDFCVASHLPENATVFPRRGFPLDNMIKQALAGAEPFNARVVPWVDGYSILEDILSQHSVIPTQ